MIDGRQIRGDRVLLDWSPSASARAGRPKLDVIAWARENAGRVCLDARQEIAIGCALENAGVEFVADPPSVWLLSDGPP